MGIGDPPYSTSLTLPRFPCAIHLSAGRTADMTVTVSSPAKYSVILGSFAQSATLSHSGKEYLLSVGYRAENITVVGTSGVLR